jgi:aspartyl-tRNA(Asn)/glutamyl-tRNA(Gln) amidotransferase subunit A
MSDAPDSLVTTAARLERRDVTAAAVVDGCLDRIERGRALNAFIDVFAREARAQAERVDREIEQGRYRGPLHGIPISLKDLIDVRGRATTAASRVRAGHVAKADARVVARLRRAGAIVIGKCNLHEFAFGTTSEDSAYGPVRHPHDPTRSAGGSSGGSAVSVATGMAFASIGTDTGGSIRIPAAVCGLVGLKPTDGEVPCDGIVPLSATLDHAGPIARSVDDAWLVHQVIAGRRLARDKPLHARTPSSLTLGVPRAYFFDRLAREVRDSVAEALDRLRASGVRIVDAELPHAPLIAPVYLHIVLSEAAEYHRRTLDARPGDYTPSVRLRLEMGRYVLAEDYVRALRGRDVLREDVKRMLLQFDALALPTLPLLAPPLGAATISLDGVDEPVRTVMLRLTQLFNLTGNPAVTIPCGSSSAGLPCGLQLVGRRGATPELLAVALACERQLASPP